MQNVVLHPYFIVVVVIVVLWAVIQKALNNVGFWQPNVNEPVQPSGIRGKEKSTPPQCHVKVIPKQAPSPFRYYLSEFSQNAITNTRLLPSPDGLFKSNPDMKMAPATEDTMADNNATSIPEGESMSNIKNKLAFLEVLTPAPSNLYNSPQIRYANIFNSLTFR